MASATTDRRLGLVGDKGMKAPVDCATTANIALSGEQTIDGVLTSSSRVLVKNQANPVQNGIYRTNTGSWTRDIDANGNYDLVCGTLVPIAGGAQAFGIYQITSAGPITVDTTAITFGVAFTAQAVSAYVQTLLAAANASAARAILGVAPRAARIDIASVAGTVDLTDNAPDTDDIRITGALAITGFTVVIGRVIRVSAGGAFTLKNNANIVTQTGADIVAAAGDTFMLRATSANTVEVMNYSSLATTAATVTTRSYLAGLTLSTAGSSATISVSPGLAADSANAVLISTASSISKTTSAWAVGTGNGGLDTGAIANNTWYHHYLIRRPDTGVVDECFSTSASAPTFGGNIPAAYTQYRRIGSGKTNGSAQWVLFQQYGDFFFWDVPVQDVNVTGPGTAAVLRTISTPLGVKCEAIINVAIGYAGTNYNWLATCPDQTDSAPTSALCTFPIFSAGTQADGQIRVMTNTSSQIRTRQSNSAAGDSTNMITTGWRDTRGRDA